MTPAEQIAALQKRVDELTERNETLGTALKAGWVQKAALRKRCDILQRMVDYFRSHEASPQADRTAAIDAIFAQLTGKGDT